MEQEGQSGTHTYFLPEPGTAMMRAPGDRDQLVDGGDGRRWVIREYAG